VGFFDAPGDKMQVTPQSLNIIFTTLNTLYQQGYTAAVPFYDRIATTVPSSSRDQTYAWMTKLPAMREWIGERVLNNLAARSYNIVNKDFELTLSISRNDIEDEQLGLYNLTFSLMGEQVKMHPDNLVFQLLQAGQTTLCYDGQNFFDVAHPIIKADGSGTVTQSNVFATTPLNPNNYAAVRTTMMSWIGEDGNPLAIIPNLLIVPPQLEQMGRQILNAEYIAQAIGANAGAAITNVYQNSAELVVVPQLANRPLEWYLVAANRAIKPIIFQQRQAPRFVYKNSETDENVFFRKEFIYGVDTRDNVGFSLWFLAAKGIG